MTTKPGEIYLIDLGMVAKVRPAVVVSRADPDSPRALSLFVPLTTENRGSAYEVALGKPHFLNKDSWASLMAVGHERIIRRLGTVSVSQLSQIKVALRHALDL